MTCFYEKQKILAWRECKKTQSTNLGKPISTKGDIIQWIGTILISKSLSNQNLYVYKYLCLIIIHSLALNYLTFDLPISFFSLDQGSLRTESILRWNGPMKKCIFHLSIWRQNINVFVKLQLSVFGHFLSFFPHLLFFQY